MFARFSSKVLENGLNSSQGRTERDVDCRRPRGTAGDTQCGSSTKLAAAMKRLMRRFNCPKFFSGRKRMLREVGKWENENACQGRKDRL